MYANRFLFSRDRSGKLVSHGFSLVELMVAITIGLLILAAVSQLFVTSRASYNYQEGMARVQEAGRFGMEFLSWDIRMAGYSGCLNKSIAATSQLRAPTDYAVNFAPGQYLQGHAYTGTGTAALNDWTPALPATYFAPNDVVPYTDVLVIRRASETSVKLTAPMATNGDAISITGNGMDSSHPTGLLQQNDIAIIGDCVSADVFQITSGTAITGSNALLHATGAGNLNNASLSLSKPYDTNAEVMKLITRVYYIGRRPSPTGNGPPALFRKTLDAGTMSTLNTEELIEGIEIMRVAYGEDTTNDKVADRYKPANSVANWANVVSVRIGLLAQSDASVDKTADVNTYLLAGVSVTPNTIDAVNNKRRRHPFNTTIQVRNP